MADESRDGDWKLLQETTLEDSSGYASLVRKYYRMSVAFCVQVLGDRHKAEDVVQKGFVNIFCARDRYEPRARFKTFLFKVLLNLCINELNRRKDPVPLSALVDEQEGSTAALFQDRDSPAPSQSLEQEETLEMITRGLMLLPPKHRAALYLREYMDMPYSEIASALEVSLNEVKVWIYRGRHRLQEILKPYLDRGERIP